MHVDALCDADVCVSHDLGGTLTGGRTVLVQPTLQIVFRIVPWLTDGFSAPGVRLLIGRTSVGIGVVVVVAVVVVV